MKVEDLRLGDRILTRDNGYRAIRWIGARHFDEAALSLYPQLRPVVVPANTFGPSIPSRDLSVSPQHRMLVTGAAETGCDTEILVAATDLKTSVLSSAQSVTYFHIMFDTHEIVLTNGSWSESFLPEEAALAGLHSTQREEILTIFPELAEPCGRNAYVPARVCVGSDVPSVARLAA